MSLQPVRFLAAARRELRREVDRYDESVSGLSDEFVAEVEACVERIATYPDSGTPHLLGTRRVLVRDFPFSIIYKVEAQQLVIITVAHQRRKPEYWLQRL